MTLEHRNGRRLGWKTLAGLLLVPLIIAAGLLGATWQSNSRLHRVEAAVVNLDQMVEVNGQTIPLGRQLAAGLVERRDDNLKWTLADAKHARQGLESGRYAAVVTIPKEFSANATSFSGRADQAKRATIQIETSQITGIADSAIAQIIADTARAKVNSLVTENYLDNIYLGFNQMGDQFKTVADASRQLSDGTQQLSDGLGQSATGSRDLATGMKSYADGVDQAKTGADQLATGLNTMHEKVKPLPDGTRQLANGADQLAGGVGQLVGGVQQIPVMMRAETITLPDGSTSPGLIPGATQYVNGVDQLVTGMEPVLTQLDKVDTSKLDPAQLQAAADRLAVVQAQLQAYAGQLDTLVQTPCPTIQGLTPQQQQAVCQQWAASHAALTTPAPELGGKTPVAWAQQVAADPQLTAALDQTRTLLPQLPTIIEQAKQIRQLKPGGQKLLGGLDQLASGIESQRDQMNQAVVGAQQLAKGADGLADGMPALVSGVGQAADGAGQLATGVGQLADGAHKLSDGTGQLADGLAKADTGGKELAKGSKQLADGLAEGATELPHYSDADRQALKTVVSSPVARDSSTDIIPGAVTTSLMVVLALWLGALAFYTVVRAVASNALSDTTPTWRVALRTLTPGLAVIAVQALLLSALTAYLLDLSAGRALGVTAVALLGGVTFLLVNHALVAWFGGVGRLVSITMVSLTAGAGIISAVPGFFDTVTPLSPLTPILHAIRAIITGSSGLSGAIGTAVLWLILAAAASFVALWRRRTVTAEGFVASLPERLKHA